MGSDGWIGVDLDGTLAEYHGFVSEEHIGEPIPEMVARVRSWLDEGREVRIFTARVHIGWNEPARIGDVERIRSIIVAWCVKHLGSPLQVTNMKDYKMIELWDDRCVQVEPNTGRPVGRSTRGL